MSANNQAVAGSKHEAQDGASSPPAAKRSKKTDDTEQLTLEATLQKGNDDKSASAKAAHGKEDKSKSEDHHTKENKPTDGTNSKSKPSTESTKEPDDVKPNLSNDDSSAVEPEGRKQAVPSNVLEKGIIYFFFRGRVNISSPSDLSDIARSYFLLRPVSTTAKLGAGPIGDAGNTRLCAIPKKALPTSGRDRWLSFVEKAGASFEDLKKEFLAGNDYETKTAGTRHSPAATPVGEGVYVMTSTGRESHLAYVLTLPEKLGEVQKEMGLKEKGSFILSTKNPDYPGPANAQLAEAPDFPKEVKDDFRSLRWAPTQPKHLDCVNAQFLLIGESSGIDKAMEQPKKDKEDDDKEKPVEELEQLADEDTKRMEDLGEDDSAAIFADLQARAKDYPKMQTTF